MINEVRNSVLSILNKNNYGYVSPSDFNLFAANAQMELYEEYFSSYNKTINAENGMVSGSPRGRTSGSDYADISKPIMETLESFLVSDFITPKLTPSSNIINNYYVPSITTVGNAAYMINRVIVYTTIEAQGLSSASASFSLIDTTTDFVLAGVSVGDIVVNRDTYQNTTVEALVGTHTLTLNDDIFSGTGVSYAVYSANTYAEAEKVSNSKIPLLQNSLLTAPSLIYPAYTNVSDCLTIYPSTIKGYGAVKADYFRYPKVPKWTYVTLSGGEPVFDQTQSDYQDFEMPNEDGYKLVMKICQYCGISIREVEVAQYAMAQEQHEQPSFSMQQ
jgi:hypothetical protein